MGEAAIGFVRAVLYLDRAMHSRKAPRKSDDGQQTVKRLPTLPKKKTMPKKIKEEYAVVLVTCGSRAEARRIARTVVTERLAACANLFESRLESVYRWKGKVEQAREFLLLMKTSKARLGRLEAEVKRLHRYEVPEFIALPIVAGSRAYLRWLGECLGSTP
jgi:periplasmic divalent cation tolerance protein